MNQHATQISSATVEANQGHPYNNRSGMTSLNGGQAQQNQVAQNTTG